VIKALHHASFHAERKLVIQVRVRARVRVRVTGP